MAILETQAIYKRNGYFGFGPISVSLEPGQVLGVLAPERKGKTTFTSILWGLILPDRGDVKLFGLPPNQHQVEVRNRAGYVPRYPRMYDRGSVLEHLNFISEFHDKWDMPYVLELLEEFDISPKKYVGNIEDEIRMRLALAAASGHRPELMILDEPHFTKAVLGFLRKRIREDNIAVVLTSTDARDLDPVADIVVDLKHGTLVSNHR